MSKNLLEKILGEKAECFTDEYVNEGFKKEIELIEKIKGSLSAEEFNLFYTMIDENEDVLYKIIRYFV